MKWPLLQSSFCAHCWEFTPYQLIQLVMKKLLWTLLRRETYIWSNEVFQPAQTVSKQIAFCVSRRDPRFELYTVEIENIASYIIITAN